jgi:hypothetical protein
MLSSTFIDDALYAALVRQLACLLSSPHYKAVEMGQKILDVQRESEDGHDVVVLSEDRFWRLCSQNDSTIKKKLR